MIKPGGRDLIAAILAVAEFTFVETGQGGGDQPEARLPSALDRLRHSLLLHRIHARQTTDGLLIERHGAAILAAFSGLRLKPVALGHQLQSIRFVNI